MEKPRPGICKTAQVIRIEDADTIEVEVKFKFSVRLIGPGGKRVYLDAPEKNTSAGVIAIKRVIELLTNENWNNEIGAPRFKEVIIFIPENDPYELMDSNSWSRLNGEIWIGDKRLGDILLEEGLAVLKEK